MFCFNLKASKNGHHRVLDLIFESQRYAIPSEDLEKTNLGNYYKNISSLKKLTKLVNEINFM